MQQCIAHSNASLVVLKILYPQVIVGVHSDESIIKLKNRVPIDNTEKRMANVKKYADQVCEIEISYSYCQ